VKGQAVNQELELQILTQLSDPGRELGIASNLHQWRHRAWVMGVRGGRRGVACTSSGRPKTDKTTIWWVRLLFSEGRYGTELLYTYSVH